MGAIHFWDHKKQDGHVDKYICKYRIHSPFFKLSKLMMTLLPVVGLKNGNVNSYRIDMQEPQKVTNFWSISIERWDMLFGKVLSMSIRNSLLLFFY